MTDILKTAAKQNKQVSTIAEINNNNNVTKKGKTMSNKTQKQQEETVQNSSNSNTELMEVTKEYDHIIKVNGKRYVDWDNIENWCDLVYRLCGDPKLFNRSGIPFQIRNDEKIQEIETEFRKWLYELIQHKISSLNTDTSGAYKTLLDKADSCFVEDWFYLFLLNRDFFTPKGASHD